MPGNLHSSAIRHADNSATEVLSQREPPGLAIESVPDVTAEKVRAPESGAWLSSGRFAAVLGLLMMGAFPKVLLGLGSFVYRDYGVLAYPFIHYAHESFWRGELPLWNPLSNCGAPFLAQWGTMSI